MIFCAWNNPNKKIITQDTVVSEMGSQIKGRDHLPTKFGSNKKSYFFKRI